ncbi:hypothetical protein [Blackfly microvirus SF02]|uniref:Uncharacterized protein n=1 Tax=Blackfly microvirus SF02 TaxID=2576452 RepID=A0A4P8PJU8_9VIRU|nr:hypothetical protein [Blackfly microvirus SF02]
MTGTHYTSIYGCVRATNACARLLYLICVPLSHSLVSDQKCGTLSPTLTTHKLLWSLVFRGHSKPSKKYEPRL